MTSIIPDIKDLKAALSTLDALPTVVTVAKGAPGSPDVRKFSLSDLNAAIDDAIKTLPADKHVVAFARADLSGARLTIAGKVPGKHPGELDWTIYVDKPWEGDVTAGAAIRWTI
jgi:hypothetical protein